MLSPRAPHERGDLLSTRCNVTGPGRIRTYDQGIHLTPAFPPGVDYLFTRARARVRVGAGCSKPVIKGTRALR